MEKQLIQAILTYMVEIVKNDHSFELWNENLSFREFMYENHAYDELNFSTEQDTVLVEIVYEGLTFTYRYWLTSEQSNGCMFNVICPAIEEMIELLDECLGELS